MAANKSKSKSGKLSEAAVAAEIRRIGLKEQAINAAKRNASRRYPSKLSGAPERFTGIRYTPYSTYKPGFQLLSDRMRLKFGQQMQEREKRLKSVVKSKKAVEVIARKKRQAYSGISRNPPNRENVARIGLLKYLDETRKPAGKPQVSELGQRFNSQLREHEWKKRPQNRFNFENPQNNIRIQRPGMDEIEDAVTREVLEARREQERLQEDARRARPENTREVHAVRQPAREEQDRAMPTQNRNHGDVMVEDAARPRRYAAPNDQVARRVAGENQVDSTIGNLMLDRFRERIYGHRWNARYMADTHGLLKELAVATYVSGFHGITDEQRKGGLNQTESEVLAQYSQLPSELRKLVKDTLNKTDLYINSNRSLSTPVVQRFMERSWEIAQRRANEAGAQVRERDVGARENRFFDMAAPREPARRRTRPPREAPRE